MYTHTHTHTHTHTYIYTGLVFHISLWLPAIHWPSGMRCLESYFLFEVKSLLEDGSCLFWWPFNTFWKLRSKLKKFISFLFDIQVVVFFQLFNYLIIFIDQYWYWLVISNFKNPQILLPVKCIRAIVKVFISALLFHLKLSPPTRTWLVAESLSLSLSLEFKIHTPSSWSHCYNPIPAQHRFSPFTSSASQHFTICTI